MSLIQPAVDVLLVGFTVVLVVTGAIAAVVVFGGMIGRSLRGW